MEHDTVIVVAGGDASSRAAAAGRCPSGAHGDRRRRRRRPGARARASRSTSRSATSTPSRAAGLAAAEAAGARIERYPADKDATDLELALDAAIALEPARIVVVGSSGGRLDHLLGSLLAARPRALRGRRDRRRSRRAPRPRRPRLASTLTRHAGRARLAPAACTAPPRASRPKGSSIRCAGETLAAGLEPRHLERLRSRRRRASRVERGVPRSPSGPAARTRRACDDHGRERWLCSSSRSRGAGAARRARGSRSKRGRARHARLVRDPEAGQGRVRAGERAEAADPPGRRRR